MTGLQHPRHILDGQVVIVTGASSGMGRATAIAVAQAGAHVVLAARRQDALEDTHTAIRDAGASALVVPCDVTDPSAVDRLIAAALGVSGHIDALIHAAGINIRDRALDNLTAQNWSSMINANLTAGFYLTHALVPIFRAQEGGLLIYIASSAVKKPDRSGVAYQASKAGLVGLAHGTMEEERGYGIRTTVIFPGLTDTPLVLQRPTPTPAEVLARALRPEDAASACLFVMGLPPRAHVPELIIDPSRL